MNSRFEPVMSALLTPNSSLLHSIQSMAQAIMPRRLAVCK